MDGRTVLLMMISVTLHASLKFYTLDDDYIGLYEDGDGGTQRRCHRVFTAVTTTATHTHTLNIYKFISTYVKQATERRLHLIAIADVVVVALNMCAFAWHRELMHRDFHCDKEQQKKKRREFRSVG